MAWRRLSTLAAVWRRLRLACRDARAWRRRQYSPGATDTEIKIGTTDAL